MVVSPVSFYLRRGGRWQGNARCRGLHTSPQAGRQVAGRQVAEPCVLPGFAHKPSGGAADGGVMHVAGVCTQAIRRGGWRRGIARGRGLCASHQAGRKVAGHCAWPGFVCEP